MQSVRRAAVAPRKAPSPPLSPPSLPPLPGARRATAYAVWFRVAAHRHACGAHTRLRGRRGGRGHVEAPPCRSLTLTLTLTLALALALTLTLTLALALALALALTLALTLTLTLTLTAGLW